VRDAASRRAAARTIKGRESNRAQAEKSCKTILAKEVSGLRHALACVAPALPMRAQVCYALIVAAGAADCLNETRLRMNTDELRAIIWDELFQAKGAKSIDEIAAFTNCDASAVRAAVTHDWFRVSEDRVSIAMAAPHLHERR
jgi:hypothetical protein